jgi:hypothetical protein
MVGSFEIFRKYQRSLLVCVAILAMLAFFVLPPFLQMGGSATSQDPVAVTWKGGELREGGLERTVAMRSLVNRFLMEAAAAGGRDPSRMPLLPEGEEQTVQTALLAQDAKANGIVVSDQSINDFLGQWTGNLVRQEQFDEILSKLRLGPFPLTQRDLFEVLRTELAARTMLMLHQSAFNADPPGWQWDYFRRLEQQSTVEVVPVIVESFAGAVPAPSESVLRAFYDKYKNDLPEARSADPGFREPHRVQYEYLVAKRGLFEDEAAKEVTDEQVAEYYEKNKTSMFRAKPASAEAKPVAAEVKATEPEAKPAATEAKPAAETPAKPVATDAKPAETPAKPADPSAAPKPAEVKPEAPPAASPATPKGAAIGGSPFQTVSFKQPAGQPAEKPAEATAKPAESATAKPAPEAAKPDAAPAGEKPAGEKPAGEKKDEQKTEDPAQFEPLDAVKDDIRKRLAGERADARIDAIFTAVAGDIGRYAEDYALWQARKPAGVEAPRPPDIAKIAEKQGLESGRSDLVAPDAAFAAGGIGGSFEFVQDPSSRFGIRQQRWLDQMFGTGSLSLRPIRSRDVEGSRYLSWRTEDQPEFTPSFETARSGVERAWRIVEGRSLAKKRAEELARQVDGKQESLQESLQTSLQQAGSGGTEMKATQVGPFSWLTQGMSGGGALVLSQPEGVSMPGDEFMRAVFSLEPGKTAVAFNEPRTVCYVIRLVSQEPPTAELQDKFIAGRNDRQKIGMVAQREASTSFRELIEGMEKRYGLDWKRQPR